MIFLVRRKYSERNSREIVVKQSLKGSSKIGTFLAALVHLAFHVEAMLDFNAKRLGATLVVTHVSHEEYRRPGATWSKRGAAGPAG